MEGTVALIKKMVRMLKIQQYMFHWGQKFMI